MLDVSIVIITWNAKELLINCLNSVYQKVKRVEFEIIVVDNHSEDSTVQVIEKRFPSIYLIKNNTNKGVAKARNQAIKVAQGKYILLLDVDTQIISDNFDHLLNYMEKNKTIGILGCSMLTGDNKPYSSARTLPNPCHIILRRLAYYGYFKKSQLLKSHHVLPQGITHPIQVGYVIGAFQLIRKQYMQTIGLLDEKMFFGYEDADFCARMKKAGFSVIFFPDFTIRHYVQGLTRKQPFSKLMLKHIKSYIIFYIKHRDILRQRYSP